MLAGNAWGREMIISHRHKFIFLKPGKVAGTSFEIALSKYLGDSDVITKIMPEDEQTRREYGFRPAQHYKYTLGEFFWNANVDDIAKAIRKKRIPLKYYNHMPAAECRRRVGEDIWNSYKKISIVRNPWDYAISYYYWNKGKTSNIEDMTLFYLESGDLLNWNHRIYMLGDQVAIDLFIRYEYFEEDIRRLESEIPGLSGLWQTFSQINAKGNIRPKAKMSLSGVYSRQPKLDALIRERCRFEIENYNYRCD